MIYLEGPAPHIPDWNGRGRRPTHLKAQSEAIRVDQWASEQPDTAWRRIELREGEKGTLEAQYLHTRAAGICWSGGRLVHAKYRTTAYPMRHLKRHCRGWCKCRHSVSLSNTVFVRQSVNAAWPTIKYADGMHGIITWLWSCWQRSSWSSKKCRAAANDQCYPSMTW